MKLIVGLGNPGIKYASTRHNIGYKAIEAFSKEQSADTWKEKKELKGFITTFKIDNEKIILLKPLTYMNKSGESVRKVVDYYDLSSEEILVIHDDSSLSFKTIRVRKGGSSGGHNGIESIINHIGDDFWRLKLGINEPPENYSLSDYVLSKFTHEEEKELSQIIEISVKVINNFVEGNIEHISIKAGGAL